jgi:hypothetical protein
MQLSDHVTEEVEDWDAQDEEPTDREKSAWDQLARPTAEDATEEEEFWSKVPEHLGDGTLLDDVADDRWIDKLKKKLPATKETEGESQEALEGTDPQ